MKKNEGWAIHSHHNIFIEYCYDYKKRVKEIKRDKPANEQAIRLRLFKLLPAKAVGEIPEEIRKGEEEWRKVRVREDWWRGIKDWGKGGKECEKKWLRIGREREKAEKEWRNAMEKNKENLELFHKKWCGCREWDGEKIVFLKMESNRKGGESMRYYNLFYEKQPNAAIIMSNLSEKEFEKLLDKYRKTDEYEYNIDDFINYLKRHGNTGEVLNTIDIYF